MEQPNRESDVRQKLLLVLEEWYVWLTSNPQVLFQESDTERMQVPVMQFSETNEWMRQSIMTKINCFFEQGARNAMHRFRKGDYDSYDPRS
ncbi:hypothetical protein GCM10025859_14450 [Alicyclobacillus fastidiosus]|nr:hypothetical protein GCM10025859_14450 [Alicyclobacillus fastidiosus]